MLPNGLQLFVADVVDNETDRQGIWYVVGKTYDSALKRFIKEANKIWYRYSYHFYEVDEKIKQDFMERYEDIKAGIYEY